MPKWLSSLLVAAGFLALVGLAFLPRSLSINIEINDTSSHHTIAAPQSDPNSREND